VDVVGVLVSVPPENRDPDARFYKTEEQHPIVANISMMLTISRCLSERGISRSSE
jgi:hypothetical protein